MNILPLARGPLLVALLASNTLALAQGAGRLGLVFGGSVAASGVGAHAELRYGLSPKFALSLRAERDAWRGTLPARSLPATRSRGAAELTAARLVSGDPLGLGLRAYGSPGHRGAFLGFDLASQRYRITANSSAEDRRGADVPGSLSPGDGIGGVSPLAPSYRAASVTTGGRTLDGSFVAGYALALGECCRLEMAYRLTRRQLLGRGSFDAVATDGSRVGLSFDEHFTDATNAAEVRFVLGL